VPVTAPADRRFRRAHVKPARRRRAWLARWGGALRALIAAGVASSSAYYLAHAIVQARGLQVSQIRVRGNQHLARGEVLALLEGLRGEHILAVNLERWRRRLLGSPWIQQAALRRVLPSTVEVLIEERRPMALGRFSGSLYLIDEDGLIIDDYTPNYARLDLPIVDGLADGPPTGGPTVDPARAALAARLLSALSAKPELMQKVSQVNVANAHDAVLLLDTDTALVHVGEEQFLERLEAYLELAGALHARVPDIEYVDLRFADRVYVRPATGSGHRAAVATAVATGQD
jgi:cell division septal protein FtsQ